MNLNQKDMQNKRNLETQSPPVSFKSFKEIPLLNYDIMSNKPLC